MRLTDETILPPTSGLNSAAHGLLIQVSDFTNTTRFPHVPMRLSAKSEGSFSTALPADLPTFRLLRSLAIVLVFVLVGVPAEAQLTQNGLILNFDAAQDQNGNLVWESLGADASRNWTFGSSIILNTSPTLGASLDGGGIRGITAAYGFPGLSAVNLADERATSATYSGFGDGADASLEFWIRLDDTATNQVIWESGGATNGSALVLTGGQLKFVSKTNPASASVAIDVPTDGNFHQVVVTIDLNQTGTNDVLSMYLDAGTPATGTSATGITSWSGSDAAGLGGYNNALGADGAQGLVQGNFQNTLAAGIASMRYYQAALTAAEI